VRFSASLQVDKTATTAHVVFMKEPLSPTAAKKMILSILADGAVVFSKHAREEMATDALVHQDALNVLRGGMIEPAEWVHDSWRYRVRTAS
jgi:hypothetical protein